MTNSRKSSGISSGVNADLIGQQKPKLTPSLSLSTPQLALLLLCQSLNISGLLAQLSPWFIGLIGLIFILRLLPLASLLELFKPSKTAGSSAGLSVWLSLPTSVSSQPNPLVIFLFIVIGIGLLALNAKSLGLMLTMVHLLVFAYWLKAFELKRKQSVQLVILLGFFVLATNLLFSQSLYFSLFIFACLVVNLLLLASFYGANRSLMAQSKLVLKLVGQSLPLAVLLFIFFPKISPFWAMPRVQSAQVGLSDHIDVGDIARLSLSNALAFRVSFNGPAPLLSQLYWRAIVLDDFNGKTWRRRYLLPKASEQLAQQLSQAKQAQADNNATHIQYQITQAANYQHWLYALERPFADNFFNRSKDYAIDHLVDNTLSLPKRLNKAMEYQVDSYLSKNGGSELTPFPVLALPQQQYSHNPKLQSYAQRLKRQAQQAGLAQQEKAQSEKSQQEQTQQEKNRPAKISRYIITQLLADFNQLPFQYTLEPPELEGDRLDQFFFSTRAGFCEHYASTMAFVLRAAGIPARVVVGYLGGEYNPNGNYYSVYQRDAHAWVEAWLEVGEGQTEKSNVDTSTAGQTRLGVWQRIDPTAAVHPLRVEQGFAGALRAEQQQINANYLSLANYQHIEWLNTLRLQLAAIDYQWTKWVINYSLSKQKNKLTAWFGNNASTKAGLLLVFAGACLLLAFMWWQRPKKVNNALPVATNLYLKAAKRFTPYGLVKAGSETAQQFLAQVQNHQQIPARVKQSFALVTECFCQLTYSNCDETSPEAQQALQQMKTQLKILANSIKHSR